jgi:hypothetical protein
MRTVAFLLALGLIGANAQAADSVTVQRETPFAADALVAGKVKRECTINAELASLLAESAKDMRIDVQLVDEADETTAGRVLVMEIVDADSAGNAFLGHHKSMTVRGKLFEDGKQIANFTARRNSMGGAFGGFKGSCTVLDRTAKALGRDIAEWLAHPAEDALLGELE